MAKSRLPVLSKRREKKLSSVIDARRATPHFSAEPVDESDLERIIEAGLQAPSGYNLQPWRFIVVRDPEQKNKLKEAAMGQPKISEAPVMIVACGDPEGWRDGDLDEMIRLAAEHGYGGPEQHAAVRKTIEGFLGGPPGDAGGIAPDMAVWVNRQTMIAFTHMMLTAESLGYDTAPMEGFYEGKVRQALGIPDRVRVCALLAIGRLSGRDKPYGGRFDKRRTVFFDAWDRH